MKRKLLFVSSLLPLDFERAVYGVFGRMRLFLEAANRVTDDLSALFYCDPELTDLDALSKTTEANLRKHWGIQASVSLCRRERKPEASRWGHYFSPMFNALSRPDYKPICGAEQISGFERALTSCPDAVIFHRLESLLPALRSGRSLPPSCLDLDDIEHVKYLREIRQPPRWPGKSLYYLQLPALLRLERRAAGRVQKTFVCSKRDQRYLARRWGLRNVVEIPNATAIPPRVPDLPRHANLLFVGTYTYGPNIAAAQHLISQIWPLVRQRLPDAKLLIVGNRPERIPAYRDAPPGVVFTGFMERLVDVYAKARVVCCPILSGAGTRVKIIEAAAYGTPVVSTKLGAEGLDFTEGSEIILAETPSQLATVCVELLLDAGKCHRIGMAARKAAQRLYDRARAIQLIGQEIEQLTAGRPAISRSASLSPH